jgi:aquaglyceroporin related protein
VGGAKAEAEFPPYVAPVAVNYYTPPAIVNFQKFRDQWGIRTLFMEFLGSFFFVFMLIMPAGGMVLTSGAQGSFLTVILSLAMAVTYAVILGGPHSGGCLSPTITLVMAIFRGFPWKYVPFYFIAQFLGAFLAGVLAYALFDPWLDQLDHGNRMAAGPLTAESSAAIFIAMPQEFIPNGHAILCELLGDIVFMITCFGLLDARNPFVHPQLAPLFVGLAVFMVSASFGWYAFVLNPFRDFGPRVYLSHYYDGIFSYHNHYSMIALFVPFIGHFIGAAIYDLLISARYHGGGGGHLNPTKNAHV